jgi:hypothetical protein
MADDKTSGLLVFLVLVTLGLTVLNTILIIKHSENSEKNTNEGMAMLEARRTNPICAGYGFKLNTTMPRNNDSSLYKNQSVIPKPSAPTEFVDV